MKRYIVRTICVVTLVLGVATMAEAQGNRGCSNASLAGAWGYTETGTVMVPNPPPSGPLAPTLAAAVGRYTFDLQGNFSGTQVSSSGGSISDDTKQGTYTVNRDCTGTLDVHITSSPSGLVRHSTWEFVLVDNAREIRAILRSTAVVTPLGELALPPILTMTATKVFNDRGDR